MRELRRLLDANAGRTLKIPICHYPLYFSTKIDREGKSSVTVEDGKTIALVQAEEWSEVVVFINSIVDSEVKVSNGSLYDMVLIEGCLAFLDQKVSRETSKSDLRNMLKRLVDEEPYLARILRIV